MVQIQNISIIVECLITQYCAERSNQLWERVTGEIRTGYRVIGAKNYNRNGNCKDWDVLGAPGPTSKVIKMGF